MKIRGVFYISMVLCVVGIVVGSFYDYQINSALFIDPKTNVFGIIFSAFGPMLSYTFFAFTCGYGLHIAIKEEKVWLKVFNYLFSIGGLLGTIFFTADKIPSINAFGVFEWGEKLTIPAFFITGIVEGALYYFGFRTGKKYNDRDLYYKTLLFVIAALISIIPFSQIIKNVVRRPRFRFIGVIEEATYRNWWEPFGSEFKAIRPTYESLFPDFSEQFKSFPSGHCGEAAICIFGLPCIAKFRHSMDKTHNLLSIFGFIYLIAMAISRMTMGAHYLTDVSLGALFTILFGYIAYEFNNVYYDKIRDKILNRKKEAK